MSDQLLADGEVKKTRASLDINTNMLKIGFLGGGKMAQALAKGFIRAGKYLFFVNARSKYLNETKLRRNVAHPYLSVSCPFL